MQRDFKRISIENIVHKAFMDIEEDPRRGLRNLVDLGVNFAKGRFQKPFLRTIQNMLEDEDSAYYTLLEQLLKNTTPAHLSTFGINVGYNSCTMGGQHHPFPGGALSLQHPLGPLPADRCKAAAGTAGSVCRHHRTGK